MKTALAPSASALMTSVPLVMPPSTYTSTRPATARQMSGSTYQSINNNISGTMRQSNREIQKRYRREREMNKTEARRR